MRERQGNLERTTSGDFRVSFGRRGNGCRSPPIASEVRSSLPIIAEPRGELPRVPDRRAGLSTEPPH